jgi:hypothetical protein
MTGTCMPDFNLPIHRLALALAMSIVPAATVMASATHAAAVHGADGSRQDPKTAKSPAPAKAQALNAIRVNARAIDQDVLPTNAQVTGPFGTARSVLETPRSVTPITPALMRAVGFTNLRDIMRIAPDTYTSTDFGAPSLPAIRGQLGEIYVDGLRQISGNNGFGIPLSLNAIETINVIKGPPPVVLGTSQRVGGFVNLHLKRPDLAAAHGSALLESGTWRRHDAQLDYSTPIVKGRSAIRVSVKVKHDGSYYDYAHYRSQDAYLAYRLKPDARSLFDASLEYDHVDFKDIAGINRPTQNLIDHGLYVTGQGVQPNGSSVPGPFALVDPTGLVKIPRHRVLTDPRDVDTVRTWIAHADYRRQLGDNLLLTSTNGYQHLTRNEVANNSFVEIIKGDDTAESRTSLSRTTSAEWLGKQATQQTQAGIDIRYVHVLGFSQFDTEADLPTGLTGPLSNRRIPLTPAQKAQLVMLRPGVYVSPGAQYPRAGQPNGYMISDTTDSTSYQTGVFVQEDLHPDARWDILLGVRSDWYAVSARDPIPPAGQVAAHDSAHHMLNDFNASVTYHPTPATSVYLAASTSGATSNSLGGGTPLGAGNRISPADFASRSRFAEIGFKAAPTQANWYADVSLFSQTRSLRNRNGSLTGIRSRGLDGQWFYHAENGFFANAGFSVLDARYDHSISYQDTRQVLDAFTGNHPGIVAGTGVGAPNFAAFGPSTRRVQGLPSLMASLLTGYRWNSGVGATFSGTWTNAFPLDYLGTVWIRAQYRLDASLSYQFDGGHTEMRLAVDNLSNRKNWAPVFDGGYFGSTDVFPTLPINLMASLRYRF